MGTGQEKIGGGSFQAGATQCRERREREVERFAGQHGEAGLGREARPEDEELARLLRSVIGSREQ